MHGMKLSAIASHNVVTIGPDDSFDRAINLMEEHDVHHLPVVEGSRLVGMLSDRDLLLAVGWMLESERRTDPRGRSLAGPRRVAEVMSQPAVHLAPHDNMRSAARMMIERHIHALPLVSAGLLVGMVTKLDLLRFGFDSPRGEAGMLPAASDRVAEHMQTHVFSVSPKDSLHAAVRVMREKHVRHVPVVANGLVVGILSDRDVRRFCGRESIADQQAQAGGKMYIGPSSVMEVMSRHVRTISPDSTLREAAHSMIESRISCLPVTQGDEIVGILTDSDLLRAIGASNE